MVDIIIKKSDLTLNNEDELLAVSDKEAICYFLKNEYSKYFVPKTIIDSGNMYLSKENQLVHKLNRVETTFPRSVPYINPKYLEYSNLRKAIPFKFYYKIAPFFPISLDDYGLFIEIFNEYGNGCYSGSNRLQIIYKEEDFFIASSLPRNYLTWTSQKQFLFDFLKMETN